MYYYKQTERQLWTVGCDSGPNGKWEPESDHSTPAEAAKRVAKLNGGDEELLERIKNLEERIKKLEEDRSQRHTNQPNADYVLSGIRPL